MAEIEYNGVSPGQTLLAGSRFNVTFERHVSFFGMSRIDTLGEAYDKAGQSRYLYATTPTRAAVAAADQKVGTFGVRARFSEVQQNPVSVGAAFTDLQRQTGFMRIRRVDAVDAKAYADTGKQETQTQTEKQEGAGENVLEKTLRTAKAAGSEASKTFGEALSFVKLALVTAAAVGVFLALREARQL